MHRDAPNLASTVVVGGGEMGDLIRAYTWSATQLGSSDTWPQSLRSVLSMLLPSKAQIILFWGPDFTVIYNDAYRPVFGGKHPSALGRPGREAWSEIWDDMLHGLLAGVVTTGEAFWAKDLLFVIERHGFMEETYFDVSYDPVRIETGVVGGVYCIVTETTERVVGARRMALLRDLAAQQTIARTIRDACVNAMETLARQPHDIVFALAYIGDDLQASTPGATELLAAASPAVVHELPITAPGVTATAGKLVVGLNPRRPFDDEYRTFVGLVANQLGTAVASAQAYEEEKRRAEALAEIDRAKTAFFSNVSHEFRTPLTLILGPVEDLLTDAALSPSDRERLELVHRNSLRLLRLVNTLLDFSRIEAGRVQASYEPTDLVSMTADLASAFRSAVERAGMELVVDCSALPDTAYVDRDMWEKIVSNLMSNAFKYTLQGRIAVRLRSDGSTAVLDVADTGVGIPAPELPRLFDRFHRVEGTQGRTHEGTGIGLALVQELVRLHGGSVAVASTPGSGTTFTVRVPLGNAHLPADRIGVRGAASPRTLGATPYVEEALRWLPETERASRSSDVIDDAIDAGPPRPQGGDADITSARILLADDNADMREYVTRMLATHYDVEGVADGAAAFASARQRRPDLIVADVMMPVMDGFELLRQLRADPALSTVPVLLLSARAGEEARVEGWGAGADDYLVKPFSARELLVRVDSHLKLARVRREAEAAIRDRERILRALVLASSDVVYRMSADWSEMRFLEGRDFIQDTHEATRGWINKYIHPDDQPQVMETIRDAIASKTVFELEHRVVRVDGTLGWTFSRAIPVTNDDGDLIEWFGTASDITVRKRMEEALHHSLESEQQARTEAERASRMKDEFLAMLSHELRTPLNAILGWSQVLGREPAASEGIRRAVETIERNSRIQLQLVEDLLDVSRIAEGKLRLNVRQVRLRDVIDAALASVRPAADAKQLRILTLLEIEGDQVTGDPSRLQQVVWNLLSNAVKFTPKGGRIQVMLERVHSHISLSVSDNGAGIDGDFLPNVFDRFRQADQTTTRMFGGMGLGLSIVKHLVELHGGTVQANSPGRGQGATFIVTLPVSLRRQTDQDADRASSDGDDLPEGTALLTGITVLYVDDEADARELATRVLSDQGALVVTADSAEEARRLLAKVRPDVLVADIGMPREDGYSLIRSIRALPDSDGGTTPAAAVTALARSEDRRRALLAGFQTHVAKPVDVIELIAVVATLARRTGR